MIKKYWRLNVATLATALTLSMTACGDNTQAQENTIPVTKAASAVVDGSVKSAVEAKIVELMGARPSMVVPAPIPGYQMAVTSQGNFFVSNDGNYMIYGRLFDLTGGSMKEVTDIGLNQFRYDKISALKTDMITYPAKGEEKYRIYVFTDITCGYCRKLHREIEQYQEAGITINYLAFPRSPESGVQMQKIWCADDPVKALDDAKLSNTVPQTECKGDDDSVQKQYELGIQFGVRGTPALVFEDGSLFPGYQPVDQLLELLKETQTH